MSGNKHFLQTEEAIGTQVFGKRYGLGVVIEMPYYSTYSMGTGVRWDDDSVVDQYVGIDGIDPNELVYGEELKKKLAALNLVADNFIEAMDRVRQAITEAISALPWYIRQPITRYDIWLLTYHGDDRVAKAARIWLRTKKRRIALKQIQILLPHIPRYRP